MTTIFNPEITAGAALERFQNFETARELGDRAAQMFLDAKAQFRALEEESPFIEAPEGYVIRIVETDPEKQMPITYSPFEMGGQEDEWIFIEPSHATEFQNGHPECFESTEDGSCAFLASEIYFGSHYAGQHYAFDASRTIRVRLANSMDMDVVELDQPQQ